MSDSARDKRDADEGGHIYFSSSGRSLEGEDEIRLTSVGVDIGSSTSHLVFSRLLLERFDNRYLMVAREVFHASEILLTPYSLDTAIDTEALGDFIRRQYTLAGIGADEVDTGALILTGVAVRRRNARAIGEIFADQAGKFVAVSAGDGLEATLAAFGSGAVAHSIRLPGRRVMNIDVGGGTSKIALCIGGEIVAITALDIGARVLSLDQDGCVDRLEPAGRRFAEELGLAIAIGAPPPECALESIADHMAERLFEALSAQSLSDETSALFRLDPLPDRMRPDIVTFSGGVSEFIYGRETRGFGDLGPLLADAIHRRVAAWGPAIERPEAGIRATVIGASQYTVQVSGSTILVHPLSTLPLRNVAAIVPDLPLDPEVLDSAAIAAAVTQALRRQDLQTAAHPVALCYRWSGSATFARLDAFCRGVAAGLAPLTERGLPLVLVGEGDVGGLVGLHFVEEARLGRPVVSIDGIAMKAFDFVDIGALLETSGAVPVVIKSLVFPGSADLGRVQRQPRPVPPAGGDFSTATATSISG